MEVVWRSLMLPLTLLPLVLICCHGDGMLHTTQGPQINYDNTEGQQINNNNTQGPHINIGTTQGPHINNDSTQGQQINNDNTQGQQINNDKTQGLDIYNEVPSKAKCPAGCICPTISDEEIEISSCRVYPGKALERLLQANLQINYLTLQNMQMVRVPQTVCYMDQAYFIDVSFNQIKSLPWDCLKKLKSLRCLVAKRNRISKISGVDFSIFPSLYELRLADNKISEIDDEAFIHVGHFTNINNVDLTGNMLVSVGPWAAVLMMSNVEVKLNKNHISKFTNHINWTFECPPSDSYGSLLLEDNQITHISEIFNGWGIDDDQGRRCIWGVGEHVKINLKGNPLRCDCVDYDVYRVIDTVSTSPAIEDLTCSAPPHLRGKSLIYVPRDELVCNLREHCPEGCECIQQPSKMNISVGCEGKGLTELPYILPDLPLPGYTYHLNFIGNNIKNIDTRPYLYHTRQALFSHNLISNVSIHALEALHGAASIQMDNNKLQFLPRNISQVSLTSVHEVTFHSNPWVCDCNAVETTSWLISLKGLLSDGYGVQCAWPKSMQGSNMLQLSQDDLLCASNSRSMLKVVCESVGVTILGCIVIIVIPLMVVSRKRVWVYKRLNWHPFDKDECVGENKDFDVFVSYANEDEAYADEYLITALQRKGYKVAYHRVNFLAGTPIHVSIEDCINRSKRTMVVLSQSFIRSSWCMWELTVALEKDGNEGTHRLLAIKYEDVNVKSLNLTLQSYFNTHTYIERDSAKFWDNLQYALPTVRLGSGDGEAYNVLRDSQGGSNVQQQHTTLVEDNGFSDSRPDAILLHSFP